MNGKILVIDDDPDVCALIREALLRREFEVEATTVGTDALQYVRDHEMDAIVTDVQLGRVNGLELCAQIAESRPDLPVIIVTAQDSAADWEQGLELGVSGYLIKANFKPELLTEVVGRTLSSRA